MHEENSSHNPATHLDPEVCTEMALDHQIHHLMADAAE